MNNLTNWEKITEWLYKYIVNKNEWYEIHILGHYLDSPILTSRANLYYNSISQDRFSAYIFEKKLILEEQPVQYCLEFAVTDSNTVEVVRCKDCKHLKIFNSNDLYAFCLKTEYKFLPFQTDTRTHFCSYGKRKEGAEE